MLFRKILSHFDNYMRPINTLSGQNVELLDVTVGYHCALKSYSPYIEER
jgi:hypothetical protein